MVAAIAFVVYLAILVSAYRSGSPFALAFVVALGALTVGAAIYARRKRGDS